ncbi:uncharacterized protein LOC117587968 [Drosophila guanche]|uniref:C-type lectin domain-containing protein n=1 Tax=Drosophila guanche TaxID=7266 RepID=A0A3B0KNU5_DROGU|nr:uncharacterized protein LOC117587968 [Drosophila guanche]SPP85508.1 Hypothetical predicted protein [Drosophila guanche]
MRIFAILCISLCQSAASLDRVGKGFYYIGNEDSSLKYCDWFHSRSDCWQHNSQLVSVETLEELKALEEYVSSKDFADGSTFATSGHSFDADMPYSWEGVKQPLTFTRWMPGEEKPLFKSYLSLVLSNSSLYMRQTFGYDNYYICEYQTPLLSIWLSLNKVNLVVLLCLILILIYLLIFGKRRKTGSSAKAVDKEKLIVV